jgi:hypothetical protein
MHQERQSPGRGERTCRPLRGLGSWGPMRIPTADAVGYSLRPLSGPPAPCRTVSTMTYPWPRLPHFGFDRVSRNVLILSRATSGEEGRSARAMARQPYAGRRPRRRNRYSIL